MIIKCSAFGVRNIGDYDWSTKPTNEALLIYYKSHAKEFCVGYEFVVQGITLVVKHISEKQKTGIYFPIL